MNQLTHPQPSTDEHYNPLVLRISFVPRGEGAQLRWEADILGSRMSRLPPPLPADDLPLVLRALDVLQDPAYPHAYTGEQGRHFAFDTIARARLAALSLWSAEGRVRPDAPRRLGRLLYRALILDPAAAQALGTVRDHAAALGRPLALELCFPPGATALAAMPWELLWDDGPTPLLLARGELATITRRLELPQPLPPQPPRNGPLRILALSPRAGIAPELRQIERAARLNAWAPLLDQGQAELEELEPVTSAGLHAALANQPPPDVLHFYGHGRMLNGEGQLLLDDGWTPAPALAAICGGIGLVALHACQGASTPLAREDEGEGEPLLGGVAQALCAAGIPAVLGMQFSVRVAAATTAVGAIYSALAAGHSLQAAVARARRQLFVAERDGMSWFVPALYLQAASGLAVLRPSAGTPAEPALADQPAPAAQSVLARGGGLIRALRLQARGHARQSVVAESGGTISDVSISSS